MLVSDHGLPPHGPGVPRQQSSQQARYDRNNNEGDFPGFGREMDDDQIYIEMVFAFLDKRGAGKNRQNKQKHRCFDLPDRRNPKYFSDDDSLGYNDRSGNQA